MINFLGIVVAASITATSSLVNAAVVVTISEVGPNVVVVGTGSLNLAGLSSGGAVIDVKYLDPRTRNFQIGGLIPDNSVGWFGEIFVNPNPPPFGASFGLGLFIEASSSAGQTIGVFRGPIEFLAVSAGYQSGAPLEGSSTFNNSTFTSLGIVPGIHTFSWGGGVNADSITVVIVPEPTQSGMLAIGGALLLRRKRRVK